MAFIPEIEAKVKHFFIFEQLVHRDIGLTAYCLRAYFFMHKSCG
jgi:hypothetical protein